VILSSKKDANQTPITDDMSVVSWRE